MFSPKLSQPGD
jgi:hypothetical protein